jgi:hypothetical protein
MELITFNKTGKPVLNFYTMFAKLEQETGRNPLCWEKGRSGHYDKWRISRGYPKVHANHENNRIWFKEYKGAPDGEITCPKYLNYWHIWTQWVCAKSYTNSDSPKKVNFVKFLKRMQDANGIVPDNHEFYLDKVREAASTMDEIDGPSLIRQYENSFKLDYELEWAMDITKMIMGWIGAEYANQTLIVNYDD